MKDDSKKKPGTKPSAKAPGATGKTYGGGVKVAVREVQVRHLDTPPRSSMAKHKPLHVPISTA